MPIIKSAKKQMRQDIKRRKKNAVIKSDIKSAWRKFVKNPTRELLRDVQSEFDKAVKKGYMKKNTAARRKALASRMSKATAGINTGVAKTAAKVEKAVKTEVKAAQKVVAKTAKAAEKKVSTTATKVEKAVKTEAKAASKVVAKAADKVAKKPAAKKPAAKK